MFPALGAFLVLAAAAAGAAALSPPPEGVHLTEADLPRPKPGLWRNTGTLDRRAQPASTHCEKGDRVFMPDTTHGSKCDPAEVVRRPDGSIWARRTCHDGKSTDVAIAVIRGDMARHYTLDGDLTAAGGAVHIVGHDEYDYIGPCPGAGKH
jgi:hypothetical protein